MPAEIVKSAEEKTEAAENVKAAEEKEEKTNVKAVSENGYKQLYLGFVKWFLIAAAVGAVVGVFGALFHHALDFATTFRKAHWYIMFGLPIAGLLIVFLYHIAGMADDRGTNAVIMEARGEKAVSLKLAPLIFAATFLTHLFGGSAGREGAALQMGASLASPFGKLLKLDRHDCSVLAMCGMAAGFSALFGTPVAAAVFAMEVTIVGVAQYTAIVPCMIASATASVVASAMGVSPTSFGTVIVPEFGAGAAFTLLKVVLLGILCAVISIIFCEAMHLAGNVYKKYIKNPYLRVLAGGAIVIVLTLLLGTYDYNGAGADVIERAFGGEAFPAAFLIKLLLTAITLGAGFKGGEIVPSFFVGSTFGCAVAPLLGLDPSFAAAVGLLSVFCGVTNCPLASIIIGVELFGGEGVIYYAAAIGISYMLSGYQGLYSEQTFLKSKHKLTDYVASGK